MKFKPHDYQSKAIEHVLNNPNCALFLQMGLGKSVVSITAITTLIESGEIKKVLIIAPKRVAENTWDTEIEKWEHTKHLTMSKVLGTEKQRKDALDVKADIYVTNRENVQWLVDLYKTRFPFDMVVIDELSSFKSPKSLRFKSLRKILPYTKRIIGLTGTPAPNSLLDLWSQIYLLDKGERLGKTLTAYRSTYFVPGRTNGIVVFDYKLRPGADKIIQNKIKDICVSMSADDYLQLPDCIFKTITVELSPKDKKCYDEFEKEQVMEIIGDNPITAANAAVLSGKLSQFAQGAIYDENKDVIELHTAKLEALEEIIEEAGDSNILLFYKYKHDLARIEEHFKKIKPVRLDNSEDIKTWNTGNIKLYLAHPASAGHGLNLQAGGDVIVWFGNTWSLELYQQANARLHRQGQTKPVTIVHIVAKGTIDEDILKSIVNKQKGQDALLEAVKARIDKYS